ncbi:MAG: AarF/ABC1/UbiB kinase family protein [Anaerolinea sp.]|nr:AarF/ABC1/UbiB kinase family protein [Anaerolinea sp.]
MKVHHSTSSSSPNGNEDARKAVRQRIEGLLSPMADVAPITVAVPEVAPEPPLLEKAPAAAPLAPPQPGMRPSNPDEGHRQFRIRRGRFRRTVLFFSLLFVRVIFWEVILRRIVGGDFVSRGRSERWRKYARRFRKLAIDMGGVMIKLGQFVSTRVDVLPPEITQELAGLQDQVPIVPFEYIKSTLQRELGSIEAHFLWVNPEPIAAASFGQVHKAQLHNGDRVVVKVQRPNITDIVQTDLAALRFVARLAMRYGPIRRRADVPALLDEFSRVLWEELDYRKEADNALTFASMFADDMGIYVPLVYLEHSTHYVLTLEDVTSIKINDFAALERAGISRKEVAQRLINCYLRQIFDFRFFHADPHPGNLFVYPLPDSHQDGPSGTGTINGKPYFEGNGNGTGKKFYLIFIDFGMTGRLTPQLVAGLRETLIAVIMQDAKGLVESYSKLGILMPSADKARIEAATRAVFEKVWGLNMNEISTLPFDQVTDVALEFSDLIMSMPFQMPQDFIYLSRTVGILSGMATGLDASFDPWREIQPFASRMLSEEASRQPGRALRLSGTAGVFADAALRTIRDFFARTYRLPALADTVLDRAERGELTVQVRPSSEFQDQVTRVENAINQISVGLIFSTTGIATTILYVSGERTLALFGAIATSVLFLMVALRAKR